MLAHGRSELLKLAEGCAPTSREMVNGWSVDVWRMSPDEARQAVELYKAVVRGGVDEEIAELLHDQGIDLDGVLAGDGEVPADGKITRADVIEMAAASSLIATHDCALDDMHMPNIPKGSLRKSDSGLDITVVKLEPGAKGALTDGERLLIASVKHSVNATSAADVRAKLAASLSKSELTSVYMGAQLRVVNARLLENGVARGDAARVYLFLRDFPSRSVQLVAVGAVDDDLVDDLLDQTRLLPAASGERRHFRGMSMAGLRDLHLRCQ